MLNEQHNNSGIAGATAGYTMSRAAANTFFPNWEHVHPLHDRLIKKTEVSDRLYCRILMLFSDWAKNLLYFVVFKAENV